MDKNLCNNGNVVQSFGFLIATCACKQAKINDTYIYYNIGRKHYRTYIQYSKKQGRDLLYCSVEPMFTCMQEEFPTKGYFVTGNNADSFPPSTFFTCTLMLQLTSYSDFVCKHLLYKLLTNKLIFDTFQSKTHAQGLEN